MADIGIISINLGLGTANFTKGINNANSQVKRFEKVTSQAFTNVNRSMTTLRFATIAGALLLATRQAIHSTQSIVKLADSYTELNNKMKLVYATASSGNRAVNSVFDIAQRTAQSVDSVGQVYQRFAQNSQALGISQKEVASLTETVSKAVAISGASTASAEASLTQFGQALASGILRGEELNSIMEQTPGLAQAIAEGLGIGVGELRAWGQAGKLSADEVIKALSNVKKNIDSKFNTKTFTIGESFERLTTNAKKTVGELDGMYGISTNVAKVIDSISDNLATIAKLSVVISAGFGLNKLTVYLRDLRASSIERAKNAQDNIVATARQTELTVANLRNELNILRVKKEQLNTTIADIQAKKSTAVSGSAESIKLINAEQRAKVNLTRTNARYTSLLDDLRTAYADNTVAQSRYQTMTKATAGATTLLTRATRITTSALNGLKVAFMSNPIGFVIGALTTAVSVFTLFSSATENAKKVTSELSDEIEKSYQNLDKLGKAQKKLLLDQTEDLTAELQNQFKAQEKIVEQAQRRIENLNRAIATTKNIKDTDPSKQAILNILNTKLAKSTREVTQARATQEQITAELNATSSKTQAIMQSTTDGNTKANQKAEDFNKKLEEQRLLLTLTGKALLDYKAKLLVVGAGVSENTKEFEQLFAKQKEILTLQDSSKQTKSVSSNSSFNVFSSKVAELKNELRQAETELKNINELGVKGITTSSQSLMQELANGENGLKNLTKSNIAELQKLANAIDEVNRKSAKANADIALANQNATQEHELATYGMTDKDKQVADYNFNLDMQLPNLSEQMGLADAQNHIQAMKDSYLNALTEMENRQFNPNIGDAINGMIDGFNQWGKKAMDVAGNVRDITIRAMDGMANAVTEMVMTGKADFRSLAISILKDIAQMIIKMLIFKALKTAFGGYADGGEVVGFASGGYTGNGGKYQPAGVVHKGEYVMTKEATSRIGVGFLNSLNYSRKKGYANGGAVDITTFNPDLSSVKPSTNVNVTVINNGEPAQASVKSERAENGDLNVTVNLVREIAKRVATDEISNNLRPGGLLAHAR